LLLRRTPDQGPATLSRAASEVSSDGVIGLDAHSDSVNRQCLPMWDKSIDPVISLEQSPLRLQRKAAPP